MQQLQPGDIVLTVPHTPASSSHKQKELMLSVVRSIHMHGKVVTVVDYPYGPTETPRMVYTHDCVFLAVPTALLTAAAYAVP